MIVIINHYGSSLRVKEGAFLISSEEGKQKLSPDEVSSILMHRGTSVSTDAAILAVHHLVDIVFMSRSGTPEARLWTHRFGSISEIRIAQLHFVRSAAGMRFIFQILHERLQGQIRLLQRIAHDRPSLASECNPAIQSIASYLEEIKKKTAHQYDSALLQSLRGLEGSAARSYFQCLGRILPEKYRFEKRSRRPAKDMFNSMLNYLYGILYVRCESALVAAGVDPYLGIMHRNEYKRPVLAFDIIERYRVWAEAVVVQLCFRLIPEEFMFSFDHDGYWLEAPGKKIIVNAFEVYMDEVVQRNGKRRTRKRHIVEDARELASLILKSREDEKKK